MINAIVASARVIIPVQPGVFSLQGITDVHEIVGLATKRLGRTNLRVLGILVNFKEHTNVTRDTVEILQHNFDDSVFSTQIPKNVSLEEAHSRGGSIFQYAPASPGAQAFQQLAQEVIERYDN
jgi:chromosome partitioning protein